MKKAICAIAAVLILVFITGHFFLFKIAQHSHKSEFKHYLKSNAVTIQKIELSPSELFVDSKTITWKDDNTEIEMNGEMYDVMEIKNSGTKVILSIVPDKVEKTLFEKYRAQAASIYNNRNSKENNGIKDLLTLKVTVKEPVRNPSSAAGSDVLFKENSFRTCFGFTTVQTPPPLV